MTEHGHDPAAFVRGKLVKIGKPDITIMDFAEERLHLFTGIDGFVDLSRKSGTGDLNRVSQTLGRNSHDVMAVVVGRILEASLLLAEFFPTAHDVLLETAVCRRMYADGCRFRSQDPFDCLLDLPQHLGRLEASDRFDNPPLKPFSLAFQPDQQPRNAGKTPFAGGGGKDVAEVVDLHVAVASLSQFFGDAADCLAPSLDPACGETVVEQPQCRPEPPSGHPGPVDVFNVLGNQHAVELLGKLFRLPTEVSGRQDSIAKIHGVGHDGRLSNTEPRCLSIVA
jgi:hypothetical protein